MQKGCASRSRLAGFVHKHDVGPGNLGALRTREARSMEHYKQSRRQLEHADGSCGSARREHWGRTARTTTGAIIITT